MKKSRKKIMKYDYLIVGAGLYGSMFAYTASKEGKSCIVIDKNDYIGGYCFTDVVAGIQVHRYGAHIFRTDSKKCWDFVNSICEFEPFINSPLAKYHGKVYNLPFNMNTFNQVFGECDINKVNDILYREKGFFPHPANAEEYALGSVGSTLYEMFIKHYTEKQWGKKCSELPASILRRIPIRFTYDNNYFDERYQGIPEKGYTYFIERLLEKASVELVCDYFDNKSWLDNIAETIVYTGPIDRFFGYKHGILEYRSVKFQHKTLNVDSFQGNAVVNYTDDTPYTRIIEHKHFRRNLPFTGKTVISYEYPCDYKENNSPCYPIPTERNLKILNEYKREAEKLENVIFGGRLAEYKYYNMNDIIEKFI